MNTAGPSVTYVLNIQAVVETTAGLDKRSAFGAYVLALPMKIKARSGSSLRIGCGGWSNFELNKHVPQMKPGYCPSDA